MAKTSSITRIKNHDDDMRKKLKSFEDHGVASWSDLTDDLLFLVMMQLGFVDFIAFSGVCKSWRSYAVSNRNMFMMSKPPVKIRIWQNDCHLEDLEERKFKTKLPHSDGRTCFGSTFGYVILFGWKTRDFWLVNPITRHQLHFPNYPRYVGARETQIRPILVFSPSILRWVFVMPNKTKLSYCIEGKQGWNHVSTTLPIRDLCCFKGKIYTLHTGGYLGELIIKSKSKWTLLEAKCEPDLYSARLVSSHDSLYLINWVCRPKKVMELDFGEMKWVSPEQKIQEYAIFVSYFMYFVAMKLESCAGRWTQQLKSYGRILDTGESQQGVICYEGPWYFPHDCLNVD